MLKNSHSVFGILLMLSTILGSLPEAGAQVFTTSQVAKTRKDGLARGDANWTTLFGNPAAHLRAPLRIDKNCFPCSGVIVNPSTPLSEYPSGRSALQISFIYHKEKDGLMDTAIPLLRVQTVNKVGEERMYTVFLTSTGWTKTDQPGDFQTLSVRYPQLGRQFQP